ncbi:MAG: HindIII family type II restriction endonuclease [Oscillospiraceae bacterium]|jgi:type II restriction enzyme|nr:HindIII family type II restriction endonuclease [Oscillospiraceae bacterium]
MAWYLYLQGGLCRKVFNQLLSLIIECVRDRFYDAVEKINNFISSADCFEDILAQIGIIPEAVGHDSTEEKLFAKASDAVLSRVFRELGLKSTVLSKRSDSADVIAQSNIHGYTLVADAKAFRLSRTAKNQKDFKVGSLSAWRKDADYAVLCSPYFQYPRNQSQIYAQAVDGDVCLLSWEHLLLLMQHGIKESELLNLSKLWGIGSVMARKTTVAEKKKCFIREFDGHILSTVGLSQMDFDRSLSISIDRIRGRGHSEKTYLEKERGTICSYSREQAVNELIKAKKIDEKIRRIDLYVKEVGVCTMS